MHRLRLNVSEDVLDGSALIARANRLDFDRARVRVVNFMGAPGAGKTSLLERLLEGLEDVRVGVLASEGMGTLDARRLTRFHAPVVRVDARALSFGGARHLDARIVRSALAQLPLLDLDILVVENVGDLVCPAEFGIGEHFRVMVSSVTEDENRPVKYPLVFRTCDLVLVNKVDLLPRFDFDLPRYLRHLDAVHPDVPRFEVSARNGRGIEAWRNWMIGLLESREVTA